jgi:hypothetical protein
VTESGPTWLEQYDRMRRWHARLHAARRVDDHFVDDCYAFFTCCFHLKDWLQADTAIPQEVRDAVEPYVEGNLWLRLCADLANGSKHMIVDRNPRFDHPARVEKIGVLDLGFGISAMPVKPAAVIVIGSDSYSPQHVADRCVAQWNVFLAQDGLRSD